ncbi:EamA family transporter [Halovenus sp. WSH3]|uniref:EamA family transporter n=1 Tax=Halovenus carboxidivorans TaxID=2692199 RepID=A0A6B0T2H6_9EURY|nr:EamA family transporter [Halovenus carboxidivorans]
MSRLRDAGLFCTLATFWGLSFPVITVGLEYLPPLLFAALRYDVAAVLLLGYAVVRGDGWRPVGRNNHLAIAGGGLFLVAGNGFLFLGQQTVPSGVAAILQALVPIATAVWALFLLGERLSVTGAVGVGIGFLGISLVVQPDPTNLLGGDTAGRLLIVGQVISVALGGVIVQHAEPSINRVPLTGWSMLLGAVVLHVASLGIGELPATSAFLPTAVGSVLYLGVFSTAIAFYIYFYIIEVHGAFEVSLVTYLVPVVATLVSVFVLQETISVLTYAGFGLVAVGFVFLKRDALADVIDGVPVAVRP